MKTDIPHISTKITGIPLLDAMPDSRRSQWAALAVNRIHHAMEGDFRSHPTAYDTLANLGLMERTRNGFKAIDPAAFGQRCKDALVMLSPYL